MSMECETASCSSRSLLQDTRYRDTGRVTLIKGTKIYNDVYVLCGHCSDCGTRYYADHESSWHDSKRLRMRFYLNNARYLKVGQSIWVDRTFSGAVLNGIYSFHASSSAFAEFWNNSFWTMQRNSARKISRRQIWHTFVQESIRRVASYCDYTLELPDRLPIEEITQSAFEILGENGIVRSAQDHFCSECTHEHKETADRIIEADPAALLGVDENRDVPALTGNDADLAIQDAAQARALAQNAMDVDEDSNHGKPVKMVVLDGIVMGHTVCFSLQLP